MEFGPTMKRVCQRVKEGVPEKCNKELSSNEFFFCAECSRELAEINKVHAPDPTSGLDIPQNLPHWFNRKAFAFELIGRRPVTLKEWARAAWNVDIFFGWFPWIKAITFIHILLWLWG